MWLLSRQLLVSDEFVLGPIRRRALTPTVRLWAIRSPFETREALCARGYPRMPEMRNGNDSLNGRYALEKDRAAVHHQGLAGDEPAGVGGEVKHGAHQVIGGEVLL